MASACALAIFSGTVLFIFRVCHALRAAPNAFSREGGAAANCICWRWLPAGASRQRRERAALRGAPPLRCFATPAVPLLALRATSPGRGSLSRRGLSPSQSNPSGLPALPKGEPRPWRARFLSLFRKGTKGILGVLLASPFGRGGCDHREQTERAPPLPCGELPPQRLRGLSIGEAKKNAFSEAASIFPLRLLLWGH